MRMPPFHFRLQALLERRRWVEEEKRQRCAQRRGERDEALRAGDRLSSALSRRAMRTSDAGSLAILEAGIAAQQRRAVEAQVSLATARDELIVASRERRVIEKLRERRRRAYEYEEARRDELEIEEANSRRRVR